MYSEPTEYLYSLAEVASHLQVPLDALRQWSQRFSAFLGVDVLAAIPRYSNADIAVLITIQKYVDQGFDDAEIRNRLTPKRIIPQAPSATALAPNEAHALLVTQDKSGLPQVVADLISTIANSQQSVLNGQATVREMMNVVVQDNFNLKDENRKLRDRVLELERVFAEYQRREETRKERLEGRVRALEQTVMALQQQTAQIVQAFRQRQQTRRRGWFG
ncbi:MAG: MerR family transcriptional regulator [Caldilineaceae bacterium]|nr:MerR family transcriptional regulator [Caldilineaceae bacterium]